MTELLLIRHGETHWNREMRFQGQADSSLTESGEHQAKLLARRIAALSPSALYTSDLGRAASTAEYIGSTCGLLPVDEPRLRERHVGILTGLTFNQIKDNHGPVWERYFDVDYCIPEGESLRQVLSRGYGFLADIAERHEGQRVVAVSHGGLWSPCCGTFCIYHPTLPGASSC